MASNNVGSQKTVVIDLKLLSNDAAKNIQDLNVKIANLKAVLKGMKDAGLQNSEQYIKLSQVLKDLNNTVKQNEKVLVANINEQKSNGDSINAMRARLKSLRAEYEDLGKAARESSIGQNLLKDIDNLTTEIKKLEFAQQDYSRQVGEYDILSKPARTALREMRLECQNLAVALSATQGKIQAQEQVVQSLATTVGTNTQEYKDAVDELNRLNKAYEDTDTHLKELEQETGKLADTLADSNKRIASFANDEQKIAAMQEGVNVLTSAFTLLQGSLKALGIESKSLLEVYARIQIVQQSLNSLMTIYKALNKDSNLMIMARVKWEQVRLVWTKAYNAALAKQNGEIAANTVAETANTAATSATAVAETAATATTFSLTAAFAALNAVLKANPIIAIASAIVLAVSGIVAVVKKLTKANKEEAEAAKKAKEAEEERMQAARDRIREQAASIGQVTQKYEEEIAKIRALIRVSESETASYKDKKTAIEELNRIIPKFNGQIDETGRLIKGNVNAIDEYIAKLRQKAQAEAYYQSLVDAYKEMSQIQLEFNIAVQELKRLQEDVDPTMWKINDAIVEQTKLVDELQKKMVGYQQTVWAVEEGAANAIDVNTIVSTPTATSTSNKDTKKDEEKKAIEDAKKMYSELQKAAKDYYTFIERLQADALQNLINQENDRYMKELEGLANAYTNAIDLSNKGDDFLKKAGIDPEALKRYITELSNAMDEASKRNKTNVEQIKKDWEEAQKKIEDDINASFNNLTSKLKYELEKESKTGIELLRLNLDRELVQLDEQMQRELEAKEYTEQQKTEIMELYAKKREKLTKDEAKAEKIYWIHLTQEILGAMSNVTNAFSSLFSVLAENDEKYAKYSRALALVDIMNNMAIGIASAIAKGMEMGWPAAAIMIPIGIATVVAGIAEAIAVFKQNNVGSAPAFATGGLVGNKTTRRKDDTVDAKLSLGEYVVNSDVVSDLGVEFFDKLNFGKKGKKLPKIGSLNIQHFATGGMVAAPNISTISQTNNSIDFESMGVVMRDAVADALVEMPNPVVSVKEITHTQNRVSVKERIARQ